MRRRPLSMQTRRNEERPDQLELYAQVRNFSPRPRTVQAALFINDQLGDAQEVALERRQAKGVLFELPALDEATLQLRLDGHDALALDDPAYAVLRNPRHYKILVIRH